MQTELFKYQTENEEFLNEIRTVEIDGDIWFVGTDVAKVLGYAKPGNAIANHCKEKGTLKQGILTKGGIQEMVLINEPNVYRLIIKSQLPSAEKFEEWIFSVVIPSIRRKGYYGNIDRSQFPNYLERYKENIHKIPRTHFSVISEMYIRLFAALEREGYVIPDKSVEGKQLMPDISVGKGFANYLKIHNFSAWENAEKYRHAFPDGREVDANMYPNELLLMFIDYIENSWIPKNAREYFGKRDPIALDYIQKLLVGKVTENKSLGKEPLPEVIEMEDKLILFDTNE